MSEKKDPIANLKPFKKGQSGNPSGRAATPPDILRARSLNRIEFQRLLNEYLTLTKGELGERLKDPDTSMLELAVGNIVYKAAKDGDQQRLTFVVEHLLGKMKEEVEVTNTYRHLTTVELIALGETAIKSLKGTIE